jgi:hypothetical protein
MSDLYDRRRKDLDTLGRAVRHVDGQIGALACVSGRPVALDLLSRADVLVALLPPLAQGYALDAFGGTERNPTRVGPSTSCAVRSPRRGANGARSASAVTSRSGHQRRSARGSSMRAS